MFVEASVFRVYLISSYSHIPSNHLIEFWLGSEGGGGNSISRNALM